MNYPEIVIFSHPGYEKSCEDIILPNFPIQKLYNCPEMCLFTYELIEYFPIFTAVLRTIDFYEKG